MYRGENVSEVILDLTWPLNMMDLFTSRSCWVGRRPIAARFNLWAASAALKALKGSLGISAMALRGALKSASFFGKAGNKNELAPLASLDLRYISANKAS